MGGNNMSLNINISLEKQLETLGLLTFAKTYQALAQTMEKEKKSMVDFLKELTQTEVNQRHQKRVEKLLKACKLPRSKHLQDFESNRIPGLSLSKIQALSFAEFIDRYENLLIFGSPGAGKTHLSIGLAREWCLQNRKVYYSSAASLVQQLLKAKSELKLDQFIKKLDGFEILVVDDISYIPFETRETDVLFTLLSARYETRSVVITSNLPFAKWNQIFKDEMTTAAAIDRLVHHAIVLELNVESYRIATAKLRKQKTAKQIEI